MFDNPSPEQENGFDEPHPLAIVSLQERFYIRHAYTFGIYENFVIQMQIESLLYKIRTFIFSHKNLCDMQFVSEHITAAFGTMLSIVIAFPGDTRFSATSIEKLEENLNKFYKNKK